MHAHKIVRIKRKFTPLWRYSKPLATSKAIQTLKSQFNGLRSSPAWRRKQSLFTITTMKSLDGGSWSLLQDRQLQKRPQWYVPVYLARALLESDRQFPIAEICHTWALQVTQTLISVTKWWSIKVQLFYLQSETQMFIWLQLPESLCVYFYHTQNWCQLTV
jgi:hypothetical protein